MTPLIGITAAHIDEEIATYPRHYYVQAVSMAGGTPLLLPVLNDNAKIEQYLKTCNGLLLTGGSDVDPVHFGNEPQQKIGRVYPERDDFELALAEKALSRNMPILAICRGIQVLNIAAGGNIFQDIYSEVSGVLQHSQKAPRPYPWHSIELVEDSILARIFGAGALRVNSFHHQAVDLVAPGFRVAARAQDGIIEAIESMDKKFVIGVQWHPESMVEQHEQFLKLFQAFVHASGLNY
ncbi:MAG TPA: gamma-glutamyl-gamma-aminobutyrate hydrolase family protein [Desulfobacteria bacterium]|nr:gamma-glutamyl-gamma-aminobutyrate hydrolase family protein [Desulfobacteria bacterium]